MALFLNVRGKVIAYRLLATGGVSQCQVEIRLLVSLAAHTLASSVILIHNHPSGELDPSDADIALTKRAKKALNLIDVKLLDHFIISDTKGVSMYAEGHL